MGLDMNIFRCSRPVVDDARIYERSELNGIILNEEDLTNPMYEQLAPYCEKARVLNSYYDMEKIRKDFGLSDEAYIFRIGPDGISVTDRKGTSSRKEVNISTDDIESKYTLNKIETCYFAKAEEVSYWRKEYHIQDWFHENLSVQVENTGYYILDENTIDEFNKAFPDDAFDAEEPTDDSALFYWEWY